MSTVIPMAAAPPIPTRTMAREPVGGTERRADRTERHEGDDGRPDDHG